VTRDIAASVRGQLQNRAKQTGRPLQELLQYFAMERFLYRLSKSEFGSRFVLKGALMFRVWNAAQSRATRDIDFLAHADNDVESITQMFKAVCKQEVIPDGVVFHGETLKGIAIKEDADYSGVRVTFRATIQNAQLPMQVDVGFGDVVNPAPAIIEYPALLDFESARLAGYPAETVIAEKFEAMVKLGQLNSRMKDFYDILILSRQFEFDGPSLATAIQATFQNRGTAIRTDASLFSGELANDKSKQLQWTAFIRKSRIEGVPPAFPKVVSELVRFLLPVTQLIEGVGRAAIAWQPDRGWQEREASN
jgi:hypothetical protein